MTEAWDPITGLSVDSNELTALLAAAVASTGSVSNTHHQNTETHMEGITFQRSEPMEAAAAAAVNAPKIAVQLFSAHGSLVEEFVSVDPATTVDRVMSLMSRVNEPNSRVTFRCGKMACIICHSARVSWHQDRFDPRNNRWDPTYETCWTTQSNAASALEMAPVWYSATQLPGYVLQIATTFFAMAQTIARSDQAIYTWRQRMEQKHLAPHHEPVALVPSMMHMLGSGGHAVARAQTPPAGFV